MKNLKIFLYLANKIKRFSFKFLLYISFFSFFKLRLFKKHLGWNCKKIMIAYEGINKEEGFHYFSLHKIHYMKEIFLFSKKNNNILTVVKVTLGNSI